MSIELGPEWRDFSRRMQRAPLILGIETHRALEASVLLIEADARRNVPQDTRRLHGTINSRVEGTFPNLRGVVGPSARYGLFVERGRPGGAKMPPVNALLGWVRRHFTPRGASPSSRAGRTRAWRGRDRELRSAAFVLARSIKRRADANPRGNAQPFMEPAWNQNRVRINALFRRLGARVVASLSGSPL